MKKVLIVLILSVFLTKMAWCAENPWTQKLPIKEGVFSYAISGTMEGKQEVYVKDYGLTIAAYRNETTKMFGMSNTSSELILTTPDWVYTVDLSDGTGTKQVNPKKIITEEFEKYSSSDQKKIIKNSEEMGITMVGGISGSVEKKATKRLGYLCDKVITMGLNAYTLAGTDFPMEISANIMGISIKEEVVNIDKGRVGGDRFKLPANAKVTHYPSADQIARDNIAMMFQSLVNGQRPVNPEEKDMADMKNEINAFQQMQQGNGNNKEGEDNGLGDLQKQLESLFGGPKDTE